MGIGNTKFKNTPKGQQNLMNLPTSGMDTTQFKTVEKTYTKEQISDDMATIFAMMKGHRDRLTDKRVKMVLIKAIFWPAFDDTFLPLKNQIEVSLFQTAMAAIDNGLALKEIMHNDAVAAEAEAEAAAKLEAEQSE